MHSVFTTMKRFHVPLLFMVQFWTIFVAASPWTSSFHQRTTSGRSFGMTTRMPSAYILSNVRQPAFSTRTKISLTTARSLNSLFQLRGGEMAAADDDESSSSLVATIRSAVRGLLEFGDNTAPILSSIFRPCVRIMEKLTGVSLLPDVKVKLKKSKKGKKKSSKQKTTSDDEESDESDVVEAKKEKKSKSAAKALKKPSETTKKHISGSLKSTNPNYRIQKELKEFIQSPPPNLSVQVGPNIRAWVVTMVGANNTIYEGEVFKLRINFPKDYPRVPPSVYFLKGYIPTHEHVYTNGDICLSLLGKDWRPTMTAQSIANSILSILSSAQHKSLPMDNANHANAKPGEYQKDWTYHDDSC